jgi:hypothetical protein
VEWCRPGPPAADADGAKVSTGHSLLSGSWVRDRRPAEFQVPQKDWQWSVKDGCLEYHIGNQDTTFCGTFKIVRTFD